MPITTLSLVVVGADYPNRKPRLRGAIPRRFEIATCKPGERVILAPEPDNPVDPRAIMVMSARGIQIGYLTADRCALVGSKIRAGLDVLAIFQSAAPQGAIIRATFDGSEPVLPERDVAADPIEDVDFWPDETYPDD
ncbi:HIRAN domain-containing protein [Sphingomonas sp. SRS2]|uniref:HIRAN domain-containing protein n=1 Tax=Sphingomonas sp. SRS2 TaxID=133190 RepID=UPI0006184D9F|nr:hypothetical protein WP12_16915 [Sphingomonas sp. SRS2]